MCDPFAVPAMKRVAGSSIVALTFMLLACPGRPQEQAAEREAEAEPEQTLIVGPAEPFERLRAFAEGPTWHPDGYLVFTDIPHDRMLALRPATDTLEVLAEPSGRAAGTMLDRGGDLIVCEGNEKGPGGRALVRWDLETRTRTPIVERFEGKRFNSPNDLTIDAKGRIYFSDPHYFDDPYAEVLELDVEAVYRVDADGSNLIRVLGAEQVTRPNGVELSLDERTLYVTDTTIDGLQQLLAFPLDDQGLPTGARELIYDFGSGRGGDGMCLDRAGNLFVAAGRHTPPGSEAERPVGLYVFDPAGKLVQRFAVDDHVVTNCTHGGRDGRTVYITGAQFLWKARSEHPGARHRDGS